MGHPYPNLFEAISAARNLRSIVGLRSFGPNLPLIANDLWALQGYAQAFIIGRPSFNQYAAPQAFPRHSDPETAEALDVLLNSADTTGNLRPGFTDTSVDWPAIYAWCAIMLTRIVLQVGE